jgi:2-polyprenyl-3-methyl-5-hydroxy-6-metoxy-1,4-benzoquinol methylase
VRYGIRPDSLGEHLALALQLAPIPVLDLLLPLVQVRALMAAAKLGVFEALREGSRGARDVAEARGLDPESTELLLRVLASSRYVRRRRGVYALTRLARATLLRGAPSELLGYAEHNFAQWRWLESLEATLEGGAGVDFHGRLPADDAAWGAYQRAMLELSRPVARELVRAVPVQVGARVLLDLGGGHGALGAALCRAHPPLRSTVIDLPAALPDCIRLKEAEGWGDVVEHRAGDLAPCELGGPADVVLLSNVLHHFTSEARGSLLSRVFRALGPDGTIAIWETEAAEAGASPELARDAIALFFRVTSSAPALSETELLESLARAGFREARVVRPPLLRGRILVHARRR